MKLKTDSTEKKQGKHLFQPGQSGNPAGRPPGALNFATKFRAFIEKVAAQNKLEPDEVEEQLLKIGFLKAKEGEYNFWRDLHDRVYGKAKETHELTGAGGAPLILPAQLIDKNDTNQDAKPSRHG
jgi:hypothetical protein